MKIEKIQKHMARRTVVIGEGDGYPMTVGIIAAIDPSDDTVRISGYVPPDDSDYNWYGFNYIRKATPDERAAFFAWLSENGRDTADGFKRFGGAPRGWEATTPAPPRMTVGSIAIALDNDGRAVMGKIVQDDRDQSPYVIEGKSGFFRMNSTHPLTLDGFRAAAAQQRAAGVVFEEGDYAALIDNDGFTRVGAILTQVGGHAHLHFEASRDVAIYGVENWSDRVVVLTKRPKV